MKKYVVRLVDYKGAICDGEVFQAKGPVEAIRKYQARCERLGICKASNDKYTMEEWLFD